MKKILAGGIALLSVIPTTFAQTTAEENLTLDAATAYGRIDNRDNPMNTPLGTTESQYSKNTTTTISSPAAAGIATFTGFNSQEMWKKFHCAFLERGFIWVAPTSHFANNQVCGTTLAGATLNISNPQLEAQRQLVRDYIAKMNGEKVETPAVSATPVAPKVETILSLQSKDSDKVTFAEYKNFAKILKDLNSDEIKKLPENEAALHIMAKLNALLLLSPNISDEVKFSVVKPFEAGFKKDEKVYAEIKKFAELEKILKLYDDKKDGEIVIARSPLLVNDIVNVELKDGKISQNMIDNRLEIQLFDKNATLVEMSDFEVEYKNLPAGIKVETPYSKGLLMVTFTADYAPKQEKIQILIKNKKTGAMVSKELTLVPRITEKTDTLASMTAFEVQEGLK